MTLKPGNLEGLKGLGIRVRVLLGFRVQCQLGFRVLLVLWVS